MFTVFILVINAQGKDRSVGWECSSVLKHVFKSQKPQAEIPTLLAPKPLLTVYRMIRGARFCHFFMPHGTLWGTPTGYII